MNDLQSVLQLLLSSEPIIDLMKVKDFQNLNPVSGVKLLLWTSEVYYPKEKKRSKILPFFGFVSYKFVDYSLQSLLLLQ